MLRSLVLFAAVHGVAAQHGGGGGSCEPVAPLTPGEIALRILGSIVLLALSALFSGLTLGLLGLDPTQLQIVKEAGAPTDRAYAAIIEPVRKKGNLLLTTLVLGNVAVISLQSIAMADLTSGLVGFFLSTALTVVFGEIVPQAFCARYALYIGAKTVPIVRVIMVVLYPVAAPLAWALDKIMGEEIGTYYTKSEFLKLVKMHVESNALDAREAGIIGGAITYKEKRVKSVMTPAARLFALQEGDRLDYDTMELIFRTGYSRIPVWNRDRTSIVGSLLAKDLLLVSPAQAHPVTAVLAFFNRTQVCLVDDEDTLETTLKTFMTSKQHIAIVRCVDDSNPGRDPVYRVAGVVSLEDVLEEILGTEISDEFDTRRVHGGGREAVLRATYHAAHPESAHGTMGIGQVEGAVGAASTTNGMTGAEVRAVAAHLCANCEPFRNRFPLDAVAELVRQCPVLDAVQSLPPAHVHAVSAAGEGEGGHAGEDLLHPLHVLYSRGTRDKHAHVCTIVLQGEVALRVGADAILATAGPWDILAPAALVDEQYTPDFTATPRTAIVRVLRIGREAYVALQQSVLSGAPLLVPGARAGGPMMMPGSAREAREAGGSGPGGMWGRGQGGTHNNFTSVRSTAKEDAVAVRLIRSVSPRSPGLLPDRHGQVVHREEERAAVSLDPWAARGTVAAASTAVQIRPADDW